MSYYQNSRNNYAGSQNQRYDNTLPKVNERRLADVIDYSHSESVTRHDRSHEDQPSYEDRQHYQNSERKQNPHAKQQQQQQQQQYQNNYDHHQSKTNDSVSHNGRAQSSAGFSDRDTGNTHNVPADGRPIQLIAADPRSGRFALNKDAAQMLMKYEGNIGFVTIAGKYRTGKSFLLNRLLGLGDRGFRVDASTDACTQGIWMWSTPIYNERENIHIFFLDTEGASSVEKSSTHDAKIFALALLMSSFFIYNSVGCIDENSINDLSLTTQLSRNIAVSTEDNSQHTLSYYTPKFLWLLRDFTLQLQDAQGKAISENQYLENALTDQSSRSKQSDTTRKVRQALLAYFKDRECMTMVRPVDEERHLQSLNNIPTNRIRPDFLNRISALKEKIFAKVTPKQLKGVNLNMRMYIAMVEKYVEAINQGGVPNISSAWDHLVENECREAFESAQDLYEVALKKLFFTEEKSKSVEELYNILKNIRDSTLEKYNKSTAAIERNDVAQQYQEELKTFIDEKEKAVVEINEELNQAHNVDLLRNLSEGFRDNLTRNVYGPKNIDNFNDDFIDVLRNYATEGNGLTKTETLVDFLEKFQPEIINSLMLSMKGDLAKAAKEVEYYKQKYAQVEDHMKQGSQISNERALNAADEIARIKALNADLAHQKDKLNGQLTNMKEDGEKGDAEKARAEKLQRQLQAKEQQIQELTRNNQEMFDKLKKKKRNACCQVS